MNPIDCVKKLYTETSYAWIGELEENEIAPIVLLKFLAGNERCTQQVRYLDGFVFTIPPKMWLTLAWTIIPKYESAPFFPYYKQKEADDIWAPIKEKIRITLNMSMTDYNKIDKYIRPIIEQNKTEWFKRMGMDRNVWSAHGMDYANMREGDKRSGKSGLDLFF